MAGDPHWSDVRLLLKGEGVDGGTTITDSSADARIPDIQTDVEVDTAVFQFGAASLWFSSFDANLVYSTSPPNLGTGAWCVDTWIYVDGRSDGQYLLDTQDTDGIAVSLSSTGKLTVDWHDQGTSSAESAVGSTTVAIQTLTHLAVSYDGTNLRGFVDGALEFTAAAEIDDATAYIAIYGWKSSGGDEFHLDEYRLTVGAARYTSAFTPPTETAPEEQGDPVYAVTATIEIDSSIAAYAATAIIEIRGTETYAATAGIEISAPVYAVTATIRVSGEETYAVTAGISVQGTAHTAANRQSIKWSPVVSIDGTDVSGRLTGEVSIECNEDAANLCTCTLIPATGTIEPLAYLGQTLTATWSDEGDGTYVAHSVLMFTGVVSDASWDPDTGLLTIEATSDLQGKVERMDRAGITTMIPGSTWSDIIFEQEADLWQYAQDRLSTTTSTLWQDAMGAIRTAPLGAKVSPDFTFTDAGRFSDTLAIETASLRDLVNEITITLDYRWSRKRHRQIRVRWIGVQDVCTYLQNPFILCTRQMVEDAANGADWSVVGSIAFTDVWPPGAYRCGSGAKTYVWGYDPIVAQLDSMQDVSQWTMGAVWTAARRYVQKVTETHTVVVQCQDSIDAVGRLPKAEDYGAESDVDVSDWTETDASTGPPSGSVKLASSDWAIDTDDEGEIDRDAIDDALEVAMAAARGDILRSHRQTRVSFDTVLQPMIDLSHTVRVNADNLQATGKVSRLIHRLDSDSGEATTTVEIAVSRHEGTGLSVSSTIAAPAKPAVTDGAEIPTTLTLRQWTGGSVASYLYPGFQGEEYSEIEDEGGFFTNVQFDSLTNTRIGTDEPNPILAKFIYPVQFVVPYPEITGTYIDAAESVATTIIEVAVPEDELACTQ